MQGIARASNAVFQLLDLKSTLEKQTKLCASKASTNAADWEGIVIDQISFSYPGTKTATLENVSLNIKQGEMVVIVGENGAGKTTLSKLLCRLYDPQQGSIKLNGQDLRSFELLNLRQKITVVNQDFAQYPASLRENIGFGNIATMDDDQKIMEVVNRTGLEKVVAQQLRNNIDAPLSKQFEAGVELSGGQWQRVAIARALFRNEESDVLILDEPTSALDPQTEHEVYELFREMADGKIAVIISHRLALARIADKIVVMKAGKIEDVGHHDELMERCEEYQTMFNRQASSYL